MLSFDDKLLQAVRATLVQLRNPCRVCGRPIDPDDETWDDDGNWYHMDCAGEIRSDMETDNEDPEVFSYA